MSDTNTIIDTNFELPGMTGLFRKNDRDLYYIANRYLLRVYTDRAIQGDIKFSNGIPFKGQVMNQLSAFMLRNIEHIAPTYLITIPDPMVSVGKLSRLLPFEMYVASHLSGKAWAKYRSEEWNENTFGINKGLKENEKLEKMLVSPYISSETAKDEFIDKDTLFSKYNADKNQYEQASAYAKKIFASASAKVKERGLILAAARYQFGSIGNEIIVAKEIHLPENSLYFYADKFEENFNAAKAQKSIEKDFVAQWIGASEKQQKKNNAAPKLSQEVISSFTSKYIELYEMLSGQKFVREHDKDLINRIGKNCYDYLDGILNI